MKIPAMDTVDPLVRELQTRRLQGMNANEKLALVDGLIGLARELKTSHLRTLYPELGEEEIRVRVTALFANVAR